MRRFIPLLMVVALATGLPVSAAQARKAVSGPGFRTYAPSGWHVDKGSKRGVWSMTILSPAAPGVRRGAARVLVIAASVKTVERRLDMGVSDKGVLAEKMIQIPSAATLLQVQFNPTPATLARAQGSIFGVSYNLHGVGTQHSATVVQHGSRIYMLEMVLTQGLSDISISAADTVRSTWRWR